jgi:hypothetical protein
VVHFIAVARRAELLGFGEKVAEQRVKGITVGLFGLHSHRRIQSNHGDQYKRKSPSIFGVCPVTQR